MILEIVIMIIETKSIEVSLHKDDTKTIVLPDKLTDEEGEELATMIANADLF